MPVQLTDSGECKVQDLDSEVGGNILKGVGINKGVNNLKIRDCALIWISASLVKQNI